MFIEEFSELKVSAWFLIARSTIPLGGHGLLRSIGCGI